MMKRLINNILVGLVFAACKTNNTIDPPPIVDIEEPVKIEDDYKPIGNDEIIGQVLNENKDILRAVAVRLTLNEDVCVNAYSDYDGKFMLLYNKDLIEENSKLELVYEGYSKKIIPFKEFTEDKTIILNQEGQIIQKNEYRSFYESIRSCTRQ